MSEKTCLIDRNVFEVYKVNPLKTNIFDMYPNIGFEILKKTEIRKDIRDIVNNADDSDSDSSIKSDDIIPSTYPVKPRKTLRLPSRNLGISGNANVTAMIIESHRPGAQGPPQIISLKQAELDLSQWKSVKTSSPQVFEAEVERERLEAKISSFKSATKSATDRLAKPKKEQENYIQLLMAISEKNARVRYQLNQRNAMLAHLSQALKKRSECAANLEREMQNIKPPSTTKSEKNNKGNNNSSSRKVGDIMKVGENNNSNNNGGDDDVVALKVYLKKAKKEVTLYRGQYVVTPMGEGTVKSIHPLSQKICIHLPFGLMYSLIARAVSWFVDIDALSDNSIRHKWKKLKEHIDIPMEYKMRIKSVLDKAGEKQADKDAASMETDSQNIESSQDDSREVGGRVGIQNSFKDNFLSVFEKEALSLSSITPPALSVFVDKMKNKSSYQTVLCQQSFNSDECVRRMGTTANVIFGNSIQHFKQISSQQESEIKVLENELLGYVRECEQINTANKKNIQLTTALRLLMFTRRIRHKHHLNAIGVNGAPLTAPKKEDKDDGAAAELLTLLQSVPLSGFRSTSPAAPDNFDEESSAALLDLGGNKKRSREVASTSVPAATSSQTVSAGASETRSGHGGRYGKRAEPAPEPPTSSAITAAATSTGSRVSSRNGGKGTVTVAATAPPESSYKNIDIQTDPVSSSKDPRNGRRGGSTASTATAIADNKDSEESDSESKEVTAKKAVVAKKSRRN